VKPWVPKDFGTWLKQMCARSTAHESQAHQSHSFLQTSQKSVLLVRFTRTFGHYQQFCAA